MSFKFPTIKRKDQLEHVWLRISLPSAGMIWSTRMRLAEVLSVRQVFFAGGRLQVAGCGLKFNYNWKTAGTKDTYIHQGFLHNVVGVFHMVKTRATSSFCKYIQQPFQMIFQMFSGYFR